MQVQPIFVTATGTDVGKTHVSLKLIEAFSKQNIRVGVCKPIETGVVAKPVDAALLLRSCQRTNPAFSRYRAEDITAYTFPLPAAPFCADSSRNITVKKILEKIDALKQRCDLLIIEGAGGLMVPITADFMMIDLIRATKSRALLVTPSRLGCINDTLLSMEAMRSRFIEFDWCVNIHEDRDSFATVTQPYYDTRFPDWWSVEEGLDRFVKKSIAQSRSGE